MKRMAAGNKVKQGGQRREPSKEQSRKNSEQRGRGGGRKEPAALGGERESEKQLR